MTDPSTTGATPTVRDREQGPTRAPKPLVYMAGPYSKPDPCVNTHEAIWLAGQVVKQTDDRAVPVVPHLSHFWHTMDPRPYEWWLTYDLELLRRCDVIFRFGGPSSGADAEVVKAEEWGIPLVRDLYGLILWLDGPWRSRQEARAASRA